LCKRANRGKNHGQVLTQPKRQVQNKGVKVVIAEDKTIGGENRGKRSTLVERGKLGSGDRKYRKVHSSVGQVGSGRLGGFGRKKKEVDSAFVGDCVARSRFWARRRGLRGMVGKNKTQSENLPAKKKQMRELEREHALGRQKGTEGHPKRKHEVGD